MNSELLEPRVGKNRVVSGVKRVERREEEKEEETGRVCTVLGAGKT